MSLADQIIDGGPYRGGDSLPIEVQVANDDELNALRDELLELRRLRAAAEARERIEIDPYYDGEPWMSLECKQCDQGFDDLQTVTLTDLVRRADEHGETCR